MSNYHILTGNRDGNAFTIALHVPIPAQPNEVGIDYRIAFVQMMQQQTESQVPFITTEEQTQLDSGELVEVTIHFHTYPAETLAQKRTRLDQLYTITAARIIRELQHRLGYWGYSRSID
jgi:hypothetical protein